MMTTTSIDTSVDAARTSACATGRMRAKLIPQSELTGARLVEEIAKLANAPGALEKMGEAARAVARPGAAKRAAEVLETLGGET